MNDVAKYLYDGCIQAIRYLVGLLKPYLRCTQRPPCIKRGISLQQDLYRCVAEKRVDATLMNAVRTRLMSTKPLHNGGTICALYLQALQIQALVDPVYRSNKGPINKIFSTDGCHDFSLSTVLNFIMATKVPVKPRLITAMLSVLESIPDPPHLLLQLDAIVHQSGRSLSLGHLYLIWNMLADPETVGMLDLKKSIFHNTLHAMNPYVTDPDRQLICQTARKLQFPVQVGRFTNRCNTDEMVGGVHNIYRTTLSQIYSEVVKQCRSTVSSVHLLKSFNKSLTKLEKLFPASNTPTNQPVFVLDGANILHVIDRKVTRNSFKRLLSVQQHICSQHHNPKIVIVLHRRWIKHWGESETMRLCSMQPDTTVFQTPYGTDDDVFTILGGILACMSRLHPTCTNIVTNDKFKQHKAALNSLHFDKWLQCTMVSHTWSRKYTCKLTLPKTSVSVMQQQIFFDGNVWVV